jgi:quercetin dioxygenase-like cupin family protein
LFKSRDLEVMRLVLLAGKTMPAHKVDGEITLHCLEGRLEVTVDGRASPLHAGQLMVLDGASVHALRALADASLLVTIALRPLVPAAAGRGCQCDGLCG